MILLDIAQAANDVADTVPSINSGDALTIAAVGLGSVGALSGSKAVVDWLKILLCLNGQQVRWLATGVCAFAVVSLAMTQIVPLLSVVFVGMYLTCFLASMLDAQHQAGKRRGRNR